MNKYLYLYKSLFSICSHFKMQLKSKNYRKCQTLLIPILLCMQLIRCHIQQWFCPVTSRLFSYNLPIISHCCLFAYFLFMRNFFQLQVPLLLILFILKSQVQLLKLISSKICLSCKHRKLAVYNFLVSNRREPFKGKTFTKSY